MRRIAIFSIFITLLLSVNAILLASKKQGYDTWFKNNILLANVHSYSILKGYKWNADPCMPKPTISASGAVKFCDGDSVVLSVPEVTGLTYLWSNGNETSTIVVKDPGDYYVTVSNSLGCSAISDTVEVRVQIYFDSSPIFISGSRYLKKSTPSILKLDSPNPVTWYRTYFATYDSKVGEGNQLTVTEPGYYHAITTNECGSSIETKPIEIVDTRIAGGNLFCGYPTILDAGFFSGNQYSYQWFKNGFKIQGAVQSSILVDQIGAYSAKITSQFDSTITDDYLVRPGIQLDSITSTATLFEGSYQEGLDLYKSCSSASFDVHYTVPQTESLPFILGNIQYHDGTSENITSTHFTLNKAADIYLTNDSVCNRRHIAYLPVETAPGTTLIAEAGNSYFSNFTIDKSKNLFVIDSYNSRVQKISVGDNNPVTVAGFGGAGSGSHQLNEPRDLYVDLSGNLYVLDKNNHRVQMWAPSAPQGITVIGANGNGNGLNQLSYPSGFDIKNNGVMYIADMGNNRVQKWSPGAQQGETVINGAQTNPVLFYITDVAADRFGNLYTMSNWGMVTKFAPGSLIGEVLPGYYTNFTVDKDSEVYVNSADGVVKISGERTVIVTSGIGEEVNTSDYSFIDDDGVVYVNSYQWEDSSIKIIKLSFDILNAEGQSIKEIILKPGVTPQLFAPDRFGYSYIWNTGSTARSISVSEPGVYTVTITDTFGCSSSKSVTVTQDASAERVIEGESSYCSGGYGAPQLFVNAAGTDHLKWYKDNVLIHESDQAFDNSITIREYGAGAYKALLFYGTDSVWTPVHTVSQGPRLDSLTTTAFYEKCSGECYDKFKSCGPSQFTVNTGLGNSFPVNVEIQYEDGSTKTLSTNTFSLDKNATVYLTSSPCSNSYVFEFHIVNPSLISEIVAGGNGRGSASDQFNKPVDVAVDNSGNIYVVDKELNRVQKRIPGTPGMVTVAGGNGSGSGSNQLKSPSKIFVSEAEDVYVLDKGNHRIQKWTKGSSIGVTVATARAYDGGIESSASFTVDKDGNVYVLDSEDGPVKRWAPGASEGEVLNLGTPLLEPFDIEIDHLNTLYIADYLGIVRVPLSGGSATTISIPVESYYINKIKVDSQGALYIDAYNSIYKAKNGSAEIVWNQGFDPGYLVSFFPAEKSTLYTLLDLYDETYSPKVIKNRTTFDITNGQGEPLDRVEICEGASVNLSAPAGYTYHWSNNSTGQTITVSEMGSYAVSISNPYGCSFTKSVEVIKVSTAKPTISYTGLTERCTGDSVILNANVNTTAAEWYRDGQLCGIGPSFTVKETGSYTVRVNSACGISPLSDSLYVEIGIPPVPRISMSGTKNLCSGPIILTANLQRVKWYRDGTYYATARVLMPTLPGVYRASAYNICGESTLTETIVIITDMPKPEVTASGPLTFCAGESVNLTAPAGYRYLWNTGATSRTIMVNTSGHYFVTVSKTGYEGCSAISDTIEVHRTLIGINGKESICEGDTTTLFASPGFSSYQWFKDDVSLGANAQGASLLVNTAGVYNVQGVKDGGSCASMPFHFDVIANPVIKKILTSATKIDSVHYSNCGPVTFSLEIEAKPLSKITQYYRLKYANGSEDQVNGAELLLGQSAEVSAFVMNENGCISSKEFVVNISTQASRPQITANGPTNICQGQNVILSAPAGFTYEWSNGASSRNITVMSSGEFTVKVTNSGGCSAVSFPVTVVVSPVAAAN